MRARSALGAIAFSLAACSSEPATLDHAPGISERESEPPKRDLTKLDIPQVASPETADGVYYCGGQTTTAKAEAYFADLAAALLNEDDPAALNRFVAPEFSINSQGRNTIYKLADFPSVTPDLVPMEDWREIQKRGLAGLFDGGWRGCALDHGKVWFDAYGEDGLRLKALNRDIEWEAP